jgi:hypothetical protein
MAMGFLDAAFVQLAVEIAHAGFGPGGFTVAKQEKTAQSGNSPPRMSTAITPMRASSQMKHWWEMAAVAHFSARFLVHLRQIQGFDHFLAN